MPLATWGTGFICPTCGREAIFDTEGALGGITQAVVMDQIMKRLNREGGTLKTKACEHKFEVKPGTRRPSR